MTQEQLHNQQVMFDRIYPDVLSIKLIDIKPPSRLRKLISELSFVKRYIDPEDTPPGCIDDDVEKHLFRVVARTRTVTKHKYPNAEDSCWVHDTGEKDRTHDVSTVQKFSNAQRDHVESLSEEEIARLNLSLDDFQLYLNVEQAGKYLKGTTVVLPKEDALIVKVIDFCDGPLVYFYNYCRWLKDHQYDGKVPRDAVFIYTLAQNNKFRNKLTRHSEVPQTTRDICLYLLYQQIKVVVSIWNEVDRNKIPSIMAEQLKGMGEYLVKNLHA